MRRLSQLAVAVAALALGYSAAFAADVPKCDATLIPIEKARAQQSLEEIQAWAESGDVVAQNELGRRIGVGNGIAKNAEVSFYWYEKAAGSGYCSAQSNLAFMYLTGEGVEKNAILAQVWYTKAANQGDERAQYALGYLNLTGTDIPKDGIAAEKWFLMAANQGYVSAQRALVVLYRDGDGATIAKNPDKAALWFTRVRDAGTTGKAWKLE